MATKYFESSITIDVYIIHVRLQNIKINLSISDRIITCINGDNIIL